MKSSASIKGHPLHPILIVFPIAFFTGTFVFDVLSKLHQSEAFWQTGKYLEIAGIASAVAAAIPGIIDYIYTVPPKSSAKQRASKHALLNSAALLLFLFAATYRDDVDFVYVIASEGAGIMLISVAGWLGGTLVHRNQIGVDIRYANAGKWKEGSFKETSGTIQVSEENELDINQMKLLKIGKKRIALARTETGYVAFDDRCTHKGGPLTGGSMICGTVQCPWHGSQFSVESGTVKAGPSKESIVTYPINMRDGKIYIILNE